MAILSFDDPIDSQSASWNPSMGLLLTVSSEGKKVALHRPHEGHTVWELQELSGKGRCCGTVWSEDGKRVGLITTKSQCLVYDVNSGRLLVELNAKEVEPTLGHWSTFNVVKNKDKFDDLNNDDIFKALPRLLPLPSVTGTSLKFSTRQHIDSLIQNGNEEGIDLLLLFGGNSLNIIINSLFNIGGVEITNDENEIMDYVTVGDDHYVLTTSMMTMQHSLIKFQLDFNVPYLNKISSSISKMIALLGYIDEVLNFLTQETKGYLEYSKKFIGILKDETDKRNVTVSDELYNLLLTGMMEDDVKDWLENTIGDRGVKKWEKLGETTFENVRRTIIYHLIPSCEKLIILLGELSSIYEILSMEEEANQEIINFINEMVGSLKEYLSSIFQYIIKINREQELFNSFISWINFVLVELQEDDPSKHRYKTSEVSQFIIDNHLEKSVLFMLIPNFRRSFNKAKIDSSDLLDKLKKFLSKRITKTDTEISLGQASNNFKLVQTGDGLVFITSTNAFLEIEKINLTSLKKESFKVVFNKTISDFKAGDGRILVLTDEELEQVDISKLFNPGIINSDEISIKLNSFDRLLKPKELSVNFTKGTACIISSDLQTYEIVDI